jgi:hypothetical protein
MNESENSTINSNRERLKNSKKKHTNFGKIAILYKCNTKLGKKILFCLSNYCDFKAFFLIYETNFNVLKAAVCGLGSL